MTWPTGLSRRALLSAFAATALAPVLGGCDQIADLVVSEELVERMGLQAWTEIRASRAPSRDAAAREAARTVCARLLSAAGERPSDWEVEVFADPAVNAFALPGRKIGLFEGILPAARDEGGLAAVIGHEIGHVRSGHSEQRLTAEIARQVGVGIVAYVLDANEIAFSREIAGLLGLGAEFGLVRPYGRQQELEADRFGVLLMAEAGYDPAAAADLWRRMAALDRSGLPAILSTHPAPEARIEAIEALVPDARANAAR